MKISLLSIILVTLIGCSDAERGFFTALGESRNIKCYSGGKLIYEGNTTGKIENEKSSDGYFFRDTTDTFIEIKADCIFTVQLKKGKRNEN